MAGAQIKTIEDQIARLRGSDGTVDLASLAACGPLWTVLLAAEGGTAPARVTLKSDPEKSPDGDILCLEGQLRLDATTDVQIELAFVQEGEGVGVHLLATLPADQELALPRLEKLALRNLAVSLDVAANGFVSGRVSGALPFGADRAAALPVAVEMPISSSDWAFYGGRYAGLGPDSGDGAADDDSLPDDASGPIPLTLPDLAERLDLSTLAAALPDGLHEIGLTDFSFVFTGTAVTSLAVGFASGPDWKWDIGQLLTLDGLRVAAAVTDPWQKSTYRVAIGGRLRPVADASLELRAGAVREWSPGSTDGQWRVEAGVPRVEVSSGLTIENLSFEFTKKDAGGWSLHGGLDARVLDHDKPLSLSVAAEISPTSDKLTFEAKNLGLTVLDLPQCGGALVVDDVAISLLGGRGTGEQTAGRGAMAFGLSAGARLKWNGGELAGILSLSTEREHPYLRFTVTGNATLTLPGPDGLRHPQLVFTGGSIEFARDADAGWGFKGETQLTLQNLAQRIQAAMPAQSLTCSIELTPDSLTFAVAMTAPPSGAAATPFAWQIPLPSTGGHPPQPLGTVRARLVDLKLSVQRAAVEFDTTIAMRLPAELNHLFGRRSDGTWREVFVTDRDVSVAFGAGVMQGKPGFSLQFLDVPFNLFTPAQDGSVHWDLGEAGAVNFTLPKLVGTAANFAAEIELHEDPNHRLQIPLRFLKSALAGRLPAQVVNLIPDDVPLSTASLFDEATGIDVDSFVKRFGLPSELEPVLQKIQFAAQHLPDRFKDYLRAERPTGFKLAVSVTPAGSVSLDLRFDGPPLRVLLPAWPSIVGLEVQSLSFGEVLGGALLKVNVDARIDAFDLFSLGVCAAAADKASYLAGMRDEIVAENLLLFVVYETGIPIPIPLFCDRLGFDYVGLLGVAAKSTWSFPEPDWSDLVALFHEASGAWSFVTDAKARFPTDVPLPFALHESYIGLPSYLGADRYVGVKGRDVFTGDAGRLVAHVADGIKFFSLYDALLAVPLSMRANKLDLALGPIGLSAEWVICTAREFGELSGTGAGRLPDAFPALTALIRLSPEEKLALLHTAADDSAAAIDAADERRIVVLLSGGWALAKLSTLQVSLAFIGGGGRGFVTGLRMTGQLAGAIGIDLRGSLRSSPGRAAGDATFSLQATGEIRVANHPLLVVGAEAHGDRNQPLTLAGKLQVLPGLSELTFTGDGHVTFAADGLSMEGRTELAVMGIEGSSTFRLTPQAFACTETIEGAVFGLWSCRLGVSGEGVHDRKRLKVTGSVANRAHLDGWATQVRDQLAASAQKTLQGYRKEIAQTLKTHASESWGRWLTTGHVIEDSALRSIDRYLAALEAALTVAQAVTGFQQAVIGEVARRLGALGSFALPLAFGQWTPSLDSATFVVGLDSSAGGKVTLALTGSMPGGGKGSWTFAADLKDGGSIVQGLAHAMIAGGK